MIRFILVFAGALLCLNQAAAAVKPCTALQAEIEAKLAAHGVKNYELIVSDKGADAAGKVVGICDGGAKRIVYLKKRTDLPAPPVANVASAQIQQPVAAEQPAPAAVSRAKPVTATVPTLPPEPLTADAPVVEVRMIDAPPVSSAAAVKSCAELKAEIAAKLAAKGVKAYELIVADRNVPAEGKVVGICESSSKKIIYSKK